MKKNRQRFAISVLTIIAMVFTLMPVMGSAAETQAAGKETVINTKATAYNPIDKVIFTERTDGRYDVSVHLDKSVYENASYADVSGWIVKDVIGNNARTLTGWDNETVKNKNYTMKISTSIWTSGSVAPGETIKLGSGAYNGIAQSKYVYGINGDSKLIEAAKSFTAPSAAVKPEPTPEPEQKKDLFDKVTGYTYDLTGKYKSVYMNVKAKSGPEKGEKLWIYNRSDGKIYGDSSTDTISAIISRENKDGSTENNFDLGEKTCQWVIVSAAGDADAVKAEAAKVSPNGNGTMKMMSSAKIINERVPGLNGKVSYSSSRYDRIGVNVDATSYYIPPDIIEVCNYNKSTGEETKYKTFTFGADDQKQKGSFTVSNLTPGTTKYYTVYVSAIIGGQKFTRHDGQYHTVKSASFKKASVAPVKMTPKKAKIVVNVPATQAASGLSTMYVYKGSKKIKTLKSNGKTSISFTYTGSKASSSSYKVKSVCAKKTSISNVSSSKKPYSNTYKQPGYITGNINNIVPYGKAAFEPWQVSYYNGKVTVTGYIANNRIFKLKSYKFKVTVSSKGSKIATKTVTYKNIKPYAIKKVSFTMSTKKYPDFRNNSAGWSVRNVSTKW